MAKNNHVIRAMVRTLYDIQSVRIKTYNQLISILYSDSLEEDENGNKRIAKDKDESVKKERAKEIQNMIAFFNEHEEEMHEKKQYRTKEKFLKELHGPIDNNVIWTMVSLHVIAKRQEDEIVNAIGRYVKETTLWKEFFESQKGCGPIVAAVILSEVDIHACRHVSSLWKYAGLDVVNGMGRSRRKEHLADFEYIDKEGNKAIKKGITFNPFLKAKLIGVFGSSILKCKGEYHTIYDNYKVRCAAAHPDYSKGHIHSMAIRYAVKMFLKNLWNAWRELEGYEKEPDYWEMYISHRSHGENMPMKPKKE